MTKHRQKNEGTLPDLMNGLCGQGEANCLNLIIKSPHSPRAPNVSQLKSLSGCGYLQIDNDINLDNKIQVNDFLKETVREFGKRSIAFHEVAGYLPFVLGEKSLNSILLPSMTANAKAAVAELPSLGLSVEAIHSVSWTIGFFTVAWH